MSEFLNINEHLLQHNKNINNVPGLDIHLQEIKPKKKNYLKEWDLNQI